MLLEQLSVADQMFHQKAWSADIAPWLVDSLEGLAVVGDPKAMRHLGFISSGVISALRPDLESAERWYRSAADLGDPVSPRRLAQIWLTLERPKHQITNALELAVAREDRLAMELLGPRLEVLSLYDEARALYAKAVALNSHTASKHLRRIYTTRWGVRDRTMKVVKLKREAEKGVGAAAYELAECYMYGEGVAANNEIAKNWLHQASKLGISAATLRLAELSSKAGDVENELALLQAAASQGSAAARLKLGGDENRLHAAEARWVPAMIDVARDRQNVAPLVARWWLHEALDLEVSAAIARELNATNQNPERMGGRSIVTPGGTQEQAPFVRGFDQPSHEFVYIIEPSESFKIVEKQRYIRIGRKKSKDVMIEVTSTSPRKSFHLASPIDLATYDPQKGLRLDCYIDPPDGDREQKLLFSEGFPAEERKILEDLFVRSCGNWVWGLTAKDVEAMEKARPASPTVFLEGWHPDDDEEMEIWLFGHFSQSKVEVSELVCECPEISVSIASITKQKASAVLKRGASDRDFEKTKDETRFCSLVHDSAVPPRLLLRRSDQVTDLTSVLAEKIFASLKESSPDSISNEEVRLPALVVVSTSATTQYSAKCRGAFDQEKLVARISWERKPGSSEIWSLLHL